MADIDSDHMTKIADMLRQRIGLNSESVGRQTLQQAVFLRMSAINLHDTSRYLTRLQSDPVEWLEFIEEIVVPESWFFREISPFECARLFAQQAIKQGNPREKLRFLSVPCCRGEEPYSLSMTLMDAGFLPHQFEIIGCDLSERSLSIARRGCYREISFREKGLFSKRLTAKYFRQHDKEWELGFDVRSTVTFRQANLTATDFLWEETYFDMIICRNLMIYMTEDARRIALGHFNRLLAPAGLLYFGHSECRLGTQAGLTAWNKCFPAAFTLPTQSTFIETTSKASVPPRLNYDDPRTALEIEQVWSRPKAETPASVVIPVMANVAAAASNLALQVDGQVEELTQARDLANRGQLHEAETLCQKLQHRCAYDADLLCLRGVIQQAYGNLHLAESYYQKSLFVAPNHVESLTHLLLFHQLRGEPVQAMNYQRRLELAKSRGS